MKRSIAALILPLIVLSFQACAKKELYYFDKITPPHVKLDKVTQTSVAHPPLLRPKGKRRTINPDSQFFTLAIPNCVDMTGLAKDLRKSLADMLYTQLFKTHRFNLYDRGELVDLDTDWIEKSLKDSFYEEKGVAKKEEGTKTHQTADSTQMDKVGASLNLQNYKEKKRNELINPLLKNADGLLLIYITSREGKGKAGAISLDYRIVSTSSDDKVVLFAGSQQIRYRTVSSKELSYDRTDISSIAEEIVKVFPNPNTKRKGQVISIDGDHVVIDIGESLHIIPGLRGYIAYVDDSIYTSDYVKAQQYAYLAKFQITQVYDKTSIAKIFPSDEIPDIKVGDVVLLK